MKHFYFAMVFSLSFSAISFSQCLTMPYMSSCGVGTGVATNGININSGQTYWYSGSGTFASGVTLNGGTLVVCGTLTLSSINFNSGTIMITTTGDLTVNNAAAIYMNGNSTIVNYGKFTCNKEVTMQNSNNYIYNAATSVSFTIVDKKLEMNSSTSFVQNYGIMKVGWLNIQSNTTAGALCLAAGSCFETNTMTNNKVNIATGSGNFFLKTSAIMNTNFTNSTSLLVYKSSTAVITGPAGWGSATVYTGGVSCFAILPIVLSDFSLKQNASDIDLSWTTSSEENNNGFEIERMGESSEWETIGFVKGNGTTSITHNYMFTDENPLSTSAYYRLKQIDNDGKFTYSQLLFCSAVGKIALSIYPNPSTSLVYFENPVSQGIALTLINSLGEVIAHVAANTGVTEFNFSDYPAGIYYVKAESGDNATIYPVMISK